MSTQPTPFLTPERYLEIERVADFKSEYFDGEMFAMAGARLAHNLIVTNAVRELGNQFRQRPCQVYASEMRVRVSATGLYTYPDIIGVCGEPQFVDRQQDTLLNPSLLAEVLSPSTEAYDRGRKFDHYKTVESLREYLLIATDRVHIDLYTQQTDGRWLLTSAGSLEETVTLESVGAVLTLAALYEKLEFPAGSGEKPPESAGVR